MSDSPAGPVPNQTEVGDCTLGDCLRSLPKLPELSERLLKLAERLTHLPESGEESLLVDLDAEPAGADKAVVRADPSDRLCRLSSALRAWDRDLGIVEHDWLPVGDGK